MSQLIKHYRGRVVDSIGDNLTAEFARVVDAVQCAVEVRQVISSKNGDLPEYPIVFFRIGINLSKDCIADSITESIISAGGWGIPISSFKLRKTFYHRISKQLEEQRSRINDLMDDLEARLDQQPERSRQR